MSFLWALIIYSIYESINQCGWDVIKVYFVDLVDTVGFYLK